MAVILTGVALYSVSKQSMLMNGYSQELKDHIQQAQEMKNDLDLMMRDVVSVGQGIIDDIDVRQTQWQKGFALSSQPVNRTAALEEKPPLAETYSQQTGKIADLLKYDSNPADEVAQENIGLKFLPEIVEMMEEEAISAQLEEFKETRTVPDRGKYADEREKEQTAVETQPEPDAVTSTKTPKDFIAAGKMRVYEIAEALGMSNKDFLTAVQAKGFAIKHHMNLVTAEEAAYLKDLFGKGTVAGPEPAKPQIQKIIWSEFTDLPPVMETEPDVWEEEIAAELEVRVQEAVKTSEEVKPVEGADAVFLPAYGDQPSIFMEHKDELKAVSEQYRQELKAAHPYIAVKALTEQGFSNKEIARILNRSQGEIGLIQNINKKKNAV